MNSCRLKWLLRIAGNGIGVLLYVNPVRSSNDFVNPCRLNWLWSTTANCRTWSCAGDVNSVRSCNEFLNPCRLNWLLLWQTAGLRGWGWRESNGGEYEEFVKAEEN